MMELSFSCPECSSGAIINLSEDEVENIKKTIVEKGRSPTLLSRCENGHELLVTLYFRDDELGVRDIAVPIGTGKEEKKKPEKELSGELDWVKDVFG
jgi:hypothetical protein